MINKLRFILLLSLLISSLSVQAMNGIFWQPQDRDLSIANTSWSALMYQLRKQGFDTLVVQWTRHGDSFSTQKDRAQLQKKIESAHQAGLELIIGLNADPEFFERQKQPTSALSHYLSRLRTLDTQQVQLWQKELSFTPKAWYISAEIDDLNWRDESVRQEMLIWLDQTKQQINRYSNLPLYISSFFTGNMAPDSYRQLIQAIRAQGVNVWVQDGSGVANLTAAQRELYLDASLNCQKTDQIAANGIIYELFKVNAATAFSASPKPLAEINRLLKPETNCSKDRLYFSLRYLPSSAGIVEHRLGQVH